jgi:List-Bact-rpt repeat protein
MDTGPSQSGAGGGTVVSVRLTTSGDGIIRGTGSDCRGSCTFQIPSGTQLQLQAIPDQGASFNGWGGPCSGSSTACPVIVDGDTSVTAAFSRPGPVQVPPPAVVGSDADVSAHFEDSNRAGHDDAVSYFRASSLLKRLK